jgi:phospholipase/carboxylesterase
MPHHDDQPVSTWGVPLDKAPAAVIMIHGRGADSADMLGLARAFGRPDLAYLAPDAAGHTWYPLSFMAPREQNEPWLSSALRLIESIVSSVLATERIPAEKIVLSGFSQGACLSSEFVLRHPRRYGGLIAFSGGLIGPPGTAWDDLSGQVSYDGMPAFFGCSDVDPHIPKERVIETDAVYSKLNAKVTRKLYPGMPHTIIDDEVVEARKILDAVSPRL